MHRFEAMDTFVRVVANGSFAGAAEEMNVSRAIVTKRIMQLEALLGAKLLNRTTRRLSATEIGLRYYDFCARILNEMRDEEANIGRMQQQPLGHLKVLATKSFGSLHMGQAISSFIEQYPGIQVSLTLSDVTVRTLDPVEHGVDVVIRLQQQPDSSLFQRRLGTVVWLPCASPDYLKAHGEPLHPLELAKHPCLVHQIYMADAHWHFQGPAGPVTVKVSGPMTTNSVLAMRMAVRQGTGIALLPTYCAAPDLASGSLVRILRDFTPPPQPICALFPHARPPHKVKLFVDHLAQRFRHPDWAAMLEAGA